ncbi:MAG: GspM family type II secretion system protein LspM [Legionella sp.]|uniref:GspM family type II secretion system protein LspM n=1 Tax=Legionella sp. TaxID=459 RepID=UPI0039E3D55C
MKNYLSSLNEREQWMVASALVCLILYCYYVLLYSPLNHRVTQKSTQLVEKIATLQWMKKVKQQYRKSKTKEVIDNSQLLTIMATQLKEDSTLKYPYQLQQTGSGDIQLTFETVPFNVFVAWLEKLNEHYQTTVKQFNAERTPTPGITRVMVLMSAAS